MGGIILQGLHLRRGKLAKFTGLKHTKLQRADRNAAKPRDLKTKELAHFTDLTITALGKSDLKNAARGGIR